MRVSIDFLPNLADGDNPRAGLREYDGELT